MITPSHSIVKGYIATTIFLWFCCCSLSASSGTAYRYKDENGRWQFTDKKPKASHEELSLSPKKTQERPQLIWEETPKGKVLMAINPWFAPVTFEILVDGSVVHKWVAAEKSKLTVFKDKDARIKVIKKKYSYKYRLGRVITGSDGMVLRPPIPKQGKFLVSQSFNGSFSHNHEPSVYAVDIAMNLSDNVHAARDGVVVVAKDDYHMGGQDRFFLDKANLIKILHSDDTFGVYAHILLGSALVKPGDIVKQGEPIANAGTSGYSTGPHLHFVIQYNNGKATVSSPFTFKHSEGVGPPKRKQWLRVAPTE